MKYALFDNIGLLVGCYTPDVHGPLMLPVYGEVPAVTEDDPSPIAPVTGEVRNPAIPSGVVEITDDQWREIIASPGARRWNGVAVVAYTPPIPPINLAAYAKAARDAKEVGGITVAGVPIATDDRSKTLVTGARLRAEKDANLVTSWSAADGQIYPLPALLIVAVSDAIGEFVAGLFETYAAIVNDLKNGVITSTDEIDVRYSALKTTF